jgi:hypothetical protein
VGSHEPGKVVEQCDHRVRRAVAAPQAERLGRGGAYLRILVLGERDEAVRGAVAVRADQPRAPQPHLRLRIRQEGLEQLAR